MLALVLAAVAAQAPAPELPPAPAAPDLPPPAAALGTPPASELHAPRALLAEIDALYRRRDEPGATDGMRARLEEAEERWPGDYEVLWRLARHSFWLADDPALPREERSRLGKAAWEWGDRATAADPKRVEGWHYAAAGVGNYALGIGVFAALRQGIEGKFKERLSRAESIDPDYEGGAIQTAWGRFWYELPWPKYSPGRSRRSLEEALRKNPDNVRARVYLADLDVKEGEEERARAELRQATGSPPGRYDAPEERRWQDVARRMLAAKGDPR